MRVGVTSDTTCLGHFPTKVSDIQVEEASYTFPTFQVQTGPCGMELDHGLRSTISTGQRRSFPQMPMLQKGKRRKPTNDFGTSQNSVGQNDRIGKQKILQWQKLSSKNSNSLWQIYI